MIKVTTESGTVYEFDFTSDPSRVRRQADAVVSGMRRDDEWLDIVSFNEASIKVGQPLRMTLEPLAEDASVTFRETTPVSSIDWD